MFVFYQCRLKRMILSNSNNDEINIVNDLPLKVGNLIQRGS